MKGQAGSVHLALETLVALAIIGMIGVGASAVVYQLINGSQRNDHQMTAVQRVENASYWLTRDAYMADHVLTDNLTLPTVLILKWTDWGYGTDNTYYSATYSMENLSDGVGQLKRRLQSTTGLNQLLEIADHIYFNPGDPANSTYFTYANPTISLRVAAKSGNYTETRNYQIARRPNF